MSLAPIRFISAGTAGFARRLETELSMIIVIALIFIFVLEIAWILR